MKITRRCDYALRTLVYMVYREDTKNDKVTTKELAHHLDIPFKVLSIVLMQLCQAKFIKSQRGATGGYYLYKNPNDITLYHIIQLVDGDIGNYEHHFTKTSTNTSVNAVQVIKSSLEDAQTQTKQALSNLTLRELATAYHKLMREDLSYSI